jgi:hypothetical protein
VKTEGSVPVYENYGPVDYDKVGDDVDGVRADAVVTPHHLSFKTKVDRWRRQNPDFFDWWETKYGCVVQFWGVRLYYGHCQFVVEHHANCLTVAGSKKWKCRDCNRCHSLVHTRRSIQGKRHRDGPTQLGRWPMYCPDCRERSSQRRASRNRKYSANYRRGMYERRGFGPRQGVPGVDAEIAKFDREQVELEHFELYHDGDDGGCSDSKCRYNISS